MSVSSCSNRRMRLHALAAATAVAVSTLAAPAFAAERLNLSGLEAGTQYDRFIVKYREGTDVTRAKAALVRATRARVAGKALALGHVRRMALGADVVKSDRKLDRAEAESLMREIAADPSVEYVELDKLNKPLLTPNDTRYGEQWGYSGTYGIKANQAWDVTNGSGAVVAVLDTGITTTAT